MFLCEQVRGRESRDPFLDRLGDSDWLRTRNPERIACLPITDSAADPKNNDDVSGTFVPLPCATVFRGIIQQSRPRSIL